MNYLMLVCGEDAPPPPDAPAIEAGSIERWIDLCGPRRIYGEVLQGPSSARTVRVRDGRVLVSDGPFVEAKEFIGGFDLLQCEDLDVAVGLAAAHPVAARAMLELRPFPADVSLDGAGAALVEAERAPEPCFMVMPCADGISAGEEVETQLMAASMAWAAELEAAGTLVFGNALQGIETATTVRVRSGATLLSDGPFVESKEFLAGVCVLRCADIDEAVAHAARFPLAAHHCVEVRPFMIWGE